MAWEWVSESDCPTSANESQRKDKGDDNGQQPTEQQSGKSAPTPEQISPSTSQLKELASSAPPSSSLSNPNSTVSFEHLKEIMLTQTQQISDLKSIVENQRLMIDQLLAHRLAASSEIPAATVVSNNDVAETTHYVEAVERTSDLLDSSESAPETVAKIIDRRSQDDSSTVRSTPDPDNQTSPGAFQSQQQTPQPAAIEYPDVTILNNNNNNNNPTSTPTSQTSPSADHVDPPTFYGQRTRARAWLSDYDSIMDINGYDNFQRLVIAEAYMVGEAREWYCRTLNASPRIDWLGFKEQFLRRFCAVDQIIRDRVRPAPRSSNCENPINSAFKAFDGFVKQIFDNNRRQ